MKPHPRIRKTVKWAGVVIFPLLLAAWIGSAWWQGWYRTPRGSDAGVGDGVLWICFYSRAGGVPASEAGWHVHRCDAPFIWWFDWSFGGSTWLLETPLWVPATPLVLATIAAWRLDALARRRERAGHCRNCGYDLAGLASGAVCPECGRA